jgi:8-amino-7-oxononanoate synthase
VLESLRDALRQELSDLESRGRLRSLPPLTGPGRIETSVGSNPVISFSSNDYLGLASDPRIADAASRANLEHGFGAAASRLVSGDLPPHRAFEAAIASYLERPAALLFPSGYQTNLGVLTTLAGPQDLVVSDALNHASLIDGCRLSRATVRVYPHADAGAARALLTDPTAATYRRRFLVTESVFSMDGDVAPLAALTAIAHGTSTALIVDEAHALGCLGPRGRGLCHQDGVVPDVLIGTLGKSLGSAGGFAAGVPELRSILENRARTFLFTTASPPSLAAAATVALGIIDSSEGESRRNRLADNIRILRSGLRRSFPTLPILPSLPSLASSEPPLTPIVAIVLGPDRRAVAASQALREQGFFVQAIRPPTVAEGTARLRATVTADHTPAHVEGLLSALRTVLA